MEYLVLGIILFIIGIGCTYVHDHFKTQIAEHGGFLKAKPTPTKATRTSSRRSIKYDEISADEQFLKKFEEFKNKAARQSAKISARDGSVSSTMTIEELMKRLERMKKDL